MTAGQLFRDGTVTFIFRLVNLGVSLGLSIATARLLGAAGRGMLALPMIDAGIATSFFAGLTTATSFSLLNRGAGRGGVRASLIVAIPLVAAGMVLVVTLGLVGRHLWATPYAVLSLPFGVISLIALGVANGTKRVRLAGAIGAASNAVLLVATLVGFTFAGRTAFVALWAWLVAQMLIAALGLVLIFRLGKSLPDGSIPPREVATFASQIGAVNVVTLLNYRADVYIIAFFTSPAVLGMYTLAVAGAEAALTATTAIATATAPHIGSLPPDRARLLTARAARSTIAIATVSCAVLAVICSPLIGLLFGPTFAPVAGVLRILLIGIIAMSANSVFSSYFTLRMGRPEIALYVAGGSAALCILMSVLLVPRYGMTGSASATAVSYLLSSIALITLFRRDAGLPLRYILWPSSDDARAYRDLAARFVAAMRRRAPNAPAAQVRR